MRYHFDWVFFICFIIWYYEFPRLLRVYFTILQQRIICGLLMRVVIIIFCYLLIKELLVIIILRRLHLWQICVWCLIKFIILLFHWWVSVERGTSLCIFLWWGLEFYFLVATMLTKHSINLFSKYQRINVIVLLLKLSCFKHGSIYVSML